MGSGHCRFWDHQAPGVLPLSHQGSKCAGALSQPAALILLPVGLPRLALASEMGDAFRASQHEACGGNSQA